MEELKSQKNRLAEELQKKQAEVSQLTANINALKKELEASKNILKEKIAEVAKLTKDIVEHNKTMLQVRYLNYVVKYLIIILSTNLLTCLGFSLSSLF